MRVHVCPNRLRFQNGTWLAPFASVQAARDHLRVLRSEKGPFTAEIILHAGTYNLAEPLLFDERDAVPTGYHTLYRAFPRGRARLQGGEIVANWTRHDNHIWAADVGREPFHVLYENGDRAHPARSPSRGYLRLLGSTDADSRSLLFDPRRVPSFSANDATISLWPGNADWNWFNELHRLGAVDHDSGVLHLRTRPRYPVQSGVRFFLQHALEFLDSPGEFYHDRATGTLYYCPYQEPVEAQCIVIPRVRTLVCIRGSDRQHPVSGLRFEGLSLTSTDFSDSFLSPVELNGVNIESHNPPENLEGAVVLENAKDISIRNCQIRNIGYSGVVARGDVTRITIRGNLIEDVGFNGVYLIGHPIGEQDTNRGHLVTNNLIRRGGRSVGHGSGVQIVQSGDNRIVHNEVHGFPRYCVSLKGLHPNRMQAILCDQSVTWENRWSLLHSRRNFIGFNNLWDANGDSQDSAPVEAWAAGQGNVIHHNYIHDTGVPEGVGFGIYLDDESIDFEVTNNLLSRVQNKTCIYVKGFRNRIADNIMLRNPTQFAATLQECRNIAFERNLIADSGDDVYEIAGPFDPATHSIDHNRFVSSCGRYGVARMPGVGDIRSWRRATGLDRNSVTTAGDADSVSLADASDSQRGAGRLGRPAGFDMAQVGLRPDFRFFRAENKETLSRLGWRATAFDSWYRNRPDLMIDGVTTTRWTALKPQHAGQWVCIDMGARRVFDAITIACGEHYPEECAVRLSNDGRSWGTMICPAAGRAPAFTIHTRRQRARFVRIELTMSNSQRIWAVSDVHMRLRARAMETAECASSSQRPNRLARNRVGWSAIAGSTATDSLIDEGYTGNPYLAIDNEPATRWSHSSCQYPGQWFVLDLGADCDLTALELECGDGYPDRMVVYRSISNGAWTEEPVRYDGKPRMSIRLPRALTRYVGLVQIGGFRELPWSIGAIRRVE